MNSKDKARLEHAVHAVHSCCGGWKGTEDTCFFLRDLPWIYKQDTCMWAMLCEKQPEYHNCINCADTD